MPLLSPLRTRHRLARLVAAVAVWASRTFLKKGGNVIGGAILLKLAPGLLREAAAGHDITLVTGTNGKSTTTAMITAAVGVAGPVTSNSDGANTPPGIMWCVANATTTDIVLEVDESWLPWIIDQVRPTTVVMLNLSRDQLHRRPELWPTAAAWREAVRTVPRVVAVADDPAVVWAASTAPSIDHVLTGSDWISDSVLCPACGGVLHDRAEAWWSDCGFARPDGSVEVKDGRVYVDGAEVGGYETLPGGANLANVAVALATTRHLLSAEKALAVIDQQVRQVAGRYSEIEVDGHRVRLLLAKNPAGWRAVMEMLRPDSAVLLVFSADGVDGLDTSWLYDVDFSGLHDRQVRVAGPRAIDLAVRLHLEGIETGDTFRGARDAMATLPPGDLDVVATYASFQNVRRELGVV